MKHFSLVRSAVALAVAATGVTAGLLTLSSPGIAGAATAAIAHNTVTLSSATGPLPKALAQPLDISSVSLGQTMATSFGANGAMVGKTTFTPAQVTLRSGAEQVPLLAVLASGQPVNVKIDVLTQAPLASGVQGSYIEYNLTNAFITGNALNATAGDYSNPSTLSFDYGALRVTSYQTQPDGSAPVTTTSCWSRVTNTANGTGC